VRVCVQWAVSGIGGNMQPVRSITCGEFYFRGFSRKNKVGKGGPNLGLVCTLRQAGTA